jgi:AraC-like DNA-binding protein
MKYEMDRPDLRSMGFHHPSRFAALYRRQFGELPSETMRAGDSSR